MKRILSTVFGAAFLIASLSTTGRAMTMNVDQILADQPAGLSASVDMTVSGSVLTITLRNTSTGGASGANGLLTGLAFHLGSSYTITSGSANVSGQTLVNVTGAVIGGNVSGEWGYQNDDAPGHFNGLGVNRIVSVMTADTTAKFSNAPIQSPNNLSGPDFGLLRTGGDAGGLAAVVNQVIITVNLGASVAAGSETQFLNRINSGLVAVTFGSPNGVPDGGSTVALLGLALSGLGWFTRRRTNRG